MRAKRGAMLLAFLSLADIIVLVAMSVLSPTGAVNIVIYSFDTFVVALIVYGFYRRMKESHIGRRFIRNNWYELPAMIPIVILAPAQSLDTYDGIIALVVIFRLLALLYVIRLSRSIEEKSRILGGHATKEVFVIFFLMFTTMAFLFYSVERPVENSQITTMGDALWWTIQTASTATFGPDPDTAAGRVVGSIIMLVGIGITTIFISSLAAGLMRSREQSSSNELGNDTKQMIKSRIDGLENLSTEDMELLLSLIRTYHESSLKSEAGS